MSPPKKLKSPSLSEDIASEIKGLWLHSPLNQAQIAAQLGALNQGRVSEVINGHRFQNVKPKQDMKWTQP